MLDLHLLHARLYRLVMLLGMAVQLDQQTLALRTLLEQFDEFSEDADLATAREILNEAVTKVEEGQTAIAQAATDALGRLGDNMSAADVEFVKGRLEAIGSSQDATKVELAKIDPEDTTGGGVVGTPEGEVVPAPPADGGGG